MFIQLLAVVFAVAIAYLVSRFCGKKAIKKECETLEDNEEDTITSFTNSCSFRDSWKFRKDPDFGNQEDDEPYVELQARKGALKASAVLDEIQAEIKMKKNERKEKMSIVQNFVKDNVITY